MKIFIAIISIITVLISIIIFGEYTYVDQTEIGFKYNVTSGKPVNQENNPLLSHGVQFSLFTINTRYFVISSEIQEHTFTSEKDENSPYNESLNWDSSEGVTMETDFTIRGRVSDPWKFYLHYGKPEQSYKGISTPHVSYINIYEAIRQAGQYTEKVMTEIAVVMTAESIRVDRSKLKATLLKEVQSYCDDFGFHVEDIIFSNRIIYLGGNTIVKAQKLITEMETKIRGEVQNLQNATSEKQKVIADAEMKATTILQDGKRKVDRIDSETEVLSLEIKASVDQIGSDGALEIKRANLFKELVSSGIIDTVYLDGDSELSSLFYDGYKEERVDKEGDSEDVTPSMLIK